MRPEGAGSDTFAVIRHPVKGNINQPDMQSRG